MQTNKPSALAPAGKRDNEPGLLQRVGFALRHGRNWLEVHDYHVGDIQSEQPVHVAAGAAVAGEVMAPKVIVSGLVYGFVVAREVAVEGQGQVWGDVYATSFQVSETGKVHGWIGSLDEASYLALRTGKMAVDDLPSAGHHLLPPDLRDDRLLAGQPDLDWSGDGDVGPANRRLAVMRRLQAEAAAALLARAEMERAFEARIAEIAGEAVSEAAALRQEVVASRSELLLLRERLAQSQETAQMRDGQVQSQTEELATLRRSLDERTAALDDMQVAFEKQNLKLADLEHHRRQLEKQLKGETERADGLVGRVENLESAFQGSLQHTAEQEESLVRWQELAEVTEARVKQLEAELKTVNLQLAENSRVVEMLRVQRDKVQREWERTQRELAEAHAEQEGFQQSWQKSTAELQAARQENDNLQDEVAALRLKFESQPAEYGHALAELATARAKISQLEDRLRRMETEAQEYYDQFLWNKASLESTRAEVEELRKVVLDQSTFVNRLQTELEEKQSQVEKWKDSVGRMTDLLYTADQKVKELESHTVQAQGRSSGQVEELRESLRQRQLQLEAYEAEVEFLHQEMEGQSKRLADIQAMLVEREIELGRLRETGAKQTQQLESFKKIAGQRIQALETELAQTKQKLQDLTVYLDRRRRRGEDVEK
ncbi:MAG: polymer-forming cytoskeletal protein [Chloroflexi bacterium]|nr:polymer-forming cytoskeletal protein [Chloroflexota bacterium]MCI0575741.1 polymer-forming cytoskeletal protein [Chloroflexota bacterium]MCI0646791.1 polymer-forming cytoskeletal protein [Chloroflexota bacterium]MCI0731494.1 polymer-forming cytoskeletal protein [Chloroflexota bacterium]